MTAPGPAAAGTEPRGAAMPFIMLAVLIDMAAIGLMVPVLPALVGSLAVSSAEQVVWYGAVTFAFSLASFLGAPVLGALSDAHGRRPVLLLGFAGLAFSFYATALAGALWMLAAVRFAAGALQSNAAVANAYVADITAPEQRAKRFGMLGAMFGLGFIVGPVAGGVLGAIDLRLPFVVAGTLALANLAYGWLVLPESLPAARRRPFSWARANPASSLRALAGLRGVGPLVGVVACSGLAQFVLYAAWVLYGSFRFGWGPLESGWSLAAVGVASVIVQGGLIGPLARRFGPQRLAVAGLASSTLAYLAWGTATEGWMMYAVIAANLLGFTVTASVQAMISSAADASSQGRTLGTVASLNSLTAVLAPLLATPLLAAVSHLPADDWRLGAPLYLCAALQAAALALAWLHLRRRRPAPTGALPASPS